MQREPPTRHSISNIWLVIANASIAPVSLVASKEEAKQRAKTLARSLGLKLYGVVVKPAPETNRALGSSLALAIPFEQPKQVSDQAEISQ